MSAVLLSAGIGSAPCVFAQDATALQQAVYRARDRVLPALVNVQPLSEVYRGGEKRRGTAIGSGVIFDDRGFVLTNYHVVAQAKRVLCRLSDQAKISGELVGGDPLTDIAVVRLHLSKLRGEHPWRAAKLGTSSDIQMGDIVLALGSPRALARSMTIGIVSNPRRYLSGKARLPTGERTGMYNTWIQTDAAINPGNSGGPLLNLRGEVVGVNARIMGMAEGIGFAIPVDVVKEVAAELIRSGGVRRSWIGVEFQSLEDIGAEDQQGVVIASVPPNSPAHRARMRPGDRLVEYNGHKILARFDEEIPTVAKIIADSPAGQQVHATVIRRGMTLQIPVVPEEMGRLLGTDMDCRVFGFTVKGITDHMVRERREVLDKVGVYVTGTSEGAGARRAGLSRGDVVRVVDGQPVPDLAAFKALYDEIARQRKKQVLLKVRRGGAVKFFVIKANYDRASKPALPRQPR